MLKRVRMCVVGVLGITASSAMGSIFQTASPYTDTAGDQVGSTNPARDIRSATITNDATNFYITINLNPAATLGTVSFDYGIGITTGSPTAGGDTSANATTHGNPYARTISIDSSLGGMMDWIGLFPAGGAGTVASPWTSYGFNDYVFGTPGSSEPANVWTKIETVSGGQPMATQNSQTGLSSITVTVPLADFISNLNLVPGATIDFDIYSTGTSAGQTAYDSLADSAPTNATNSATTQYNGTVLDSYTLQVPEPATLGLLGVGSLVLMKRRGKSRI